jgi:aminoglycoside phosphotransferase
MGDDESKNDWALPDARSLTERERQELCKILFNALLEIRALGNEGKAEQAADVADAFHNLPIFLWSEQFSLNFFRRFLEEYQQKYQEAGRFDYVKMLDEMTKEK